MNQRPKKPTLYQQLKHEWLELDLACKAIFIIGIILVFQLVYAIFICNPTIGSSVDSIFRTSLSSIFGYILGMNIPHDSKKDTSTEPIPSTNETDPILQKKKPHLMATNIRVMYSTLICIMCIIVLILAKCSNHMDYTEGVSQIGHLISTTIGFLISSSSHQH